MPVAISVEKLQFRHTGKSSKVSVTMDVKEAVKRAKNYVAEIFEDEGLSNLGLEEIEHDDQSGTWNVTLGFSRPWNTNRNALTALTGDAPKSRTYKVVRVRDIDGEIISVIRQENQN